MKEDKTANTLPQPETENQTKAKKGRSRIYWRKEERIRVNNESRKPRKESKHNFWKNYKKKEGEPNWIW